MSLKVVKDKSLQANPSPQKAGIPSCSGIPAQTIKHMVQQQASLWWTREGGGGHVALGWLHRNRRGMRHTSTALYFYGASKKSPHKPRTTFGNMLFQISSGFNKYLQLLLLQFLSKSRLNFKKPTFGIKIALFLQSLLYQSMNVKIVHLQNKTFTY
jgi:hypothetical protein